MSTELTWRQAIDKVLLSSQSPLHYNEIAERVISEGLRKNLGATPATTVNTMITASIKNDGDLSPYIRVSVGTFSMKAQSSGSLIASIKHKPDVSESEETEAQYEIFTSFGMFWRKDAIEWVATPKLLGQQTGASTHVDFFKQIGIYLLYDGREIIYVGRSTDRPLGKRLYEHTTDRLSTRWDRFSWFGLLPVSDTGDIGVLPEIYNATKLIPALEAILIEALEPRQNRKRGDDLATVEYNQKIDPEIEKKKIKASFDAVMNRL